ncbi:MAG: TetR/AcrR family transcriptional regulator [Candidatus Krumholzibacteria bacterium]|nr:TetR/AcrR family transcriptional regulator [Candidatus Krumholzibacteria bacterium]
MVRKTIFSRADVVKAGLAVMDKGGVENLSARRVAEEMGASTAPVYSNFANMDDLVMAVKMAAVELLLESTLENPTDNPFLNMGVGVLEFARKHPLLYGALFLQANDECVAGPGFMKELLERMAVLPDLEQLKPVERIILLRKMSLFTHGLATHICTGLQPGIEWKDVLNLLDEAGDAILADAVARSPRTEEDLASLGSLCEFPLQPTKDAK